MTITDEKLSAYIDGELVADEIAAIDHALKSDAALAARVDDMRRPDRLIAAAYGEIDKEPMPDAVMQLLQPGPDQFKSEMDDNVIQFPLQRFLQTPQQWATPLAASLALAIGVGLGLQLAGGNGAGESDNFLIAQSIDATSPIHHALETTSSAETITAGEAIITPVLTFKSIDGDYCREFTITSGELANRAVACRHYDQWKLKFAVVVHSQSGNSSDYATASTEIGSQFDSFVESLMADDALDAQAEQQILDNWPATNADDR